MSGLPDQSEISEATVCARGDLLLVARHDRRGVADGSVVVKDPIALRYWLLNEAEAAVLKWLRSPQSIAALKARLEQRFFPKRTTLREMHSVIGMLHRRGLLISTGDAQADELSRRKQEQRKREYLRWANPLMLRFPGVNPDALVDPLTRLARRVLKPWMLLAWVAFACTVAMMVFSRRSQLQADFPVLDEFLSWHTLPMLMISLAIGKVVHELGHAVMCTWFGARCHEIGFALFFFSPCLYCDTSDCWILPRRWHRIAVALAGIGAELVLASVIALAWCFCTPGAVRQQLFYVLVTCTGFTLLINLNPLLRYDGYYVLSDALNEPNLQTKSRSLFYSELNRVLFAITPYHTATYSWPRYLFLLLYAATSMAYRTIIIGVALYFIFLLFDHLGLPGVGLALCFTTLVAMSIPVAKNALKKIRNPSRRRWSWRRTIVSMTVLAVAIGFGASVPLPYHQTIQGTVRPLDDTPLFVTSAGRIEHRFVAAGDLVTKGDRIATLANPELEQRLLSLNQRLAIAELKRVQFRRRQGADAEAAAKIEAADTEFSELQNQKRLLQDEMSALELFAPITGRIFDAERAEDNTNSQKQSALSSAVLTDTNLLAWLDAGTPICRVGHANRVEVVCHVQEEELGSIRTNASAQVLFQRNGTQAWQRHHGAAQVESIGHASSRSHFSGLRSVPHAENQTMPQRTLLVRLTLAEARLEQGDGSSQLAAREVDGVGALVRIRCGSQSIFQRIRQAFVKYFQWRR